MKVAQSSYSLQPHGLYSLWNSLGQNTGMGRLSLLQGIFPTKGSIPGLPHCRRILYQLSHKENPTTDNLLFWLFSSNFWFSVSYGNGSNSGMVHKPPVRKFTAILSSIFETFPIHFCSTSWRRKWQPTPVFLPGESQGWGSLVGCCLWGCTELDMTERLSSSSSSEGRQI